MTDEKKTCQRISHPHLSPGWICCGNGNDNCRTYNGDARNNCKQCNHERCGEQPKVKYIPIQKEDGTVSIQAVQVPDDPKKGN